MESYGDAIRTQNRSSRRTLISVCVTKVPKERMFVCGLESILGRIDLTTVFTVRCALSLIRGHCPSTPIHCDWLGYMTKCPLIFPAPESIIIMM
jgi:hypothetical protein